MSKSLTSAGNARKIKLRRQAARPEPRFTGLPAKRLGPALTPGFARTPAVPSPVSRGFSLFCFSLFRRGDPLQALVNASLCVMLALVANVFLDPFEIPCAEAHHAIPALPFEQFPAFAEFAVHLMGGSALELADELRDGNGRCDAQADMHMRFRCRRFHGYTRLAC
jgi:hypothetical protein